MWACVCARVLCTSGRELGGRGVEVDGQTLAAYRLWKLRSHVPDFDKAPKTHMDISNYWRDCESISENCVFVRRANGLNKYTHTHKHTYNVTACVSSVIYLCRSSADDLFVFVYSLRFNATPCGVLSQIQLGWNVFHFRHTTHEPH